MRGHFVAFQTDCTVNRKPLQKRGVASDSVLLNMQLRNVHKAAAITWHVTVWSAWEPAEQGEGWRAAELGAAMARAAKGRVNMRQKEQGKGGKMRGKRAEHRW
jgi:hypothetical protein